MTTANDMIGMLRRHYIPDEAHPAGIFAAEIQAPGGSGRRADLIWQGVTAATGYRLIGHEVKVSRADVLAELADPTKSDPWQRYCDRWYLVVSEPALIEGLEIPDTWGVLAPPSGRRTRTCTVLRKAPELHPVEQAPAVRTVAGRVHWRIRDLDVRHQADQREIERLRERGRELESRAPREHVSTEARARTELVDQIVRRLSGRFPTYENGLIGDSIDGRISVDDLVEALSGAQAVRGVIERVERDREYALHAFRSAAMHLSQAVERVNQQIEKERVA